MAKKDVGRPSLGERVHVGTNIPKELFDRLEAFRVERMAIRASLIERAIEEYLDREAPVKGAKGKS